MFSSVKTTYRLRYLLSLSVLVSAAAVPTIAVSQTYSLTDLGTMGGVPNTLAQGINNAGQVVGYTETAGGATRPFLWNNGSMTDLGTLGGSSAQALAINSAGQVAGVSYLADQTTEHATLWSGGTPTDLGTLGGSPSGAQGINDSGQVVGYSFNSTNISRAFLWSGGTMSDLGSLNGTTGQAFANGINATSVIVGGSTPVGGGSYTATLWQGGTITDLNPSAGTASSATGVNSAGQIVGSIGNSAALWTNGTPTILGASSSALGINAGGQIVGVSDSTSSGVAAIFTGGNILNLNTLIDPTSPNAANITLTKALGINDSGSIIANAEQGYCVQSPCTTHAFLLTPEVLSLTVVPSTLSFGNQTLGKASAPQAITVTNTASTAFGFNSFQLPADYSQTNNCGAYLAAGATCTIQVGFTPTAFGARGGNFAVASGGTNYPVSLTGYGQISASLSASASTILVGSPVTLTWTSSSGSNCSPTGGAAGDGWTGSLGATGSLSATESATGQFTYVVTCTGGGQTAQAQVTVTVSLLTASVTASQSSVTVGQPVTLAWNAPLATTCVMSGGGTGDGWNGTRVVPTQSVTVTESVAGT